MLRYGSVFCLAIVSCSTGCRSCLKAGCQPGLKPVAGVPLVTIDGIAAAPTTAGISSIAGLGDLEVDQLNPPELRKRHVRPVKATEVIETKHVVRLTVRQQVDTKNYDYRALLGPTFGSTERALGKIVESAPRLYIQSGWGFFWGKYPVAETNWVVAGGQGTEMAVEIESPDLQRVYYPVAKANDCTNCYVTVTCGDKDLGALKDQGTFMIITAGCHAEVKKIADDPAAKAFMKRVTSIADTGR